MSLGPLIRRMLFLLDDLRPHGETDEGKQRETAKGA